MTKCTNEAYKSREHRTEDRQALENLRVALNVSHTALRQDDCGAWTLQGKAGRVHTMGPVAAESGYLLTAYSKTPSQWAVDKRHLSFCRVTQNGDDHGSLYLSNLPDFKQATIIRRTFGLRKASKSRTKAEPTACSKPVWPKPLNHTPIPGSPPLHDPVALGRALTEAEKWENVQHYRSPQLLAEQD